MTENLHAKFGTLETQIAANHTELMNALNSIAYALGAPPTAPSITLADVVDALTATNALLTAGNAITTGIRADLNAQLNSIGQQLDTANSNASLNAQRILAALMQLYCACDPNAPLLPPPLDVTPISADDQAKCRRIQFFGDLFATYIIRVANYIASGAAISGRALDDALQGVLLGQDITTGALAAAGGMPDSVRSTAVDQLANQMVLVGRAAVRAGLLDLVGLTATEIIRQALYGATNAADGKAAFDAAILTATSNNKYAEIAQTLFYSAWANDIFSDVPIIDDSMYDGTICAPIISPIDPGENCITVSSVLGVTTDDGQTLNAVVWPNYGTNILPSSVRPPSYPDIVASANIWYNGSNLNGYWVRGTNLSGGAASGIVYPRSDGAFAFGFNGSYQQIVVDTSYIAVIGVSSEVFVFEICEDLPE